MWLHGFVKCTRSHYDLHDHHGMGNEIANIILPTSSPDALSDSIKALRALKTPSTIASVRAPPISHLSNKEMKTLKGRDSGYSIDGEDISFLTYEISRGSRRH